MESFVTSTFSVFLGEMGDKTQLLALALMAMYRRPLAILAGIFAATTLNHALAVAAGDWVNQAISGDWLRWLLALSFAACGLWALKPDHLDRAPRRRRLHPFLATTGAFFLAEMGDKTQLLTAMLSAKYGSWLPVLAGSTLGLMLANLPILCFANHLLERLPMQYFRRATAALLLLMAVLTLAAGGAVG